MGSAHDQPAVESMNCYAQLARVLIAVAICVGSALVGPAAIAWEEDVHFGLVRWLALQAGYAPNWATTVAEGDLRADQGILDARRLVFWYACVGAEPSGSREVRNHHFPTFRDVPSPPEDRAVDPESRKALTAAEERAGRRVSATASMEEKQDRLLELGDGLHALEDSWSHQGVPEIPNVEGLPICRSDLAWAHPKTRGGWRSHDADLTHYHVSDLIALAQTTYRLLRTFATNNPWATPGIAKEWSAIEPNIRIFAGAKTKDEKRRWFTAVGFQDISFLAHISLPDGEAGVAVGRPSRSLHQPAGAQAFPEPSQSAKTFFADFFDTWMVRRNDADLVNRLVDPAAFVRTVGISGVGSTVSVTQDAFAIWRIRDHGLVARLGHGTTPSGIQEYQKLRSAGLVRALVNFEKLQEAMIPFVGGQPFVVIPLPDGRIAALAKFSHAPHDTVIVIAAPTTSGLRVVALHFVVEH